MNLPNKCQPWARCDLMPGNPSKALCNALRDFLWRIVPCAVSTAERWGEHSGTERGRLEDRVCDRDRDRDRDSHRDSDRDRATQRGRTATCTSAQETHAHTHTHTNTHTHTGYRDSNMVGHVNSAGSLGWDFKNDLWAVGPPCPWKTPAPAFDKVRQNCMLDPKC